jgi:NAD(P)-dependent dehydrogenase (short-subunit alcohol dehydrogenase family)
MAYSITKAAQLHMTSCLAQTWGPKVRVNAVLPGLLLTEWGKKFPQEVIKGLEEQAALKSTTDLGECADMYIAIAKNTSMTGQRITVGKLKSVSFLSFISFPFRSNHTSYMLKSLKPC